MSGQILRQVEKFVQCGVKVAEDVTVMAVHMSLSGKPPKVPVNKDMSGLCFTRLECWIQMPCGSWDGYKPVNVLNYPLPNAKLQYLERQITK